jgi:erythromycin esterase-like protein
MWGNEEVRELIDWMRDHNRAEGAARPVGIYGMDVYSVAESIDDVIAFLRADDPAAAARAEARYKCFAPYRRDGMEEYGSRVTTGTARSCAAPAAEQLKELALRARSHGEGHRPGDDQLISAWQNARVVANAEAYYRAMYAAGDSWNVRDRHMADTIDALSSHLNVDAASPAKLIVWAHNSHLGDARVTERAAAGELNVGQLMRQRHDGASILVGFTTYEGNVLAAARWGAAGRAQPLRPALPESFSALLHQTGIAAFSLRLRGNPQVADALARPRLQRFVGVIYAPETERQSHYFKAEVARQYDAVVHIDRTSAVEPLDFAGGS